MRPFAVRTAATSTQPEVMDVGVYTSYVRMYTTNEYLKHYHFHHLFA